MRKGISRKVFRRGGYREEYLSLMAKRPLTPADIYRLEILSLLLMNQQAQQVSK